MKVTVSRDKLVEILKKNRDSHRAVFEEALEGYRKVALEELQSKIDAIKSNGKKPVQLYIHLQRPEDHTKDYDDVIELINMTEQNLIDLSEGDFKQYVKDDWGWKRQWSVSNSIYSATAAAEAALDED